MNTAAAGRRVENLVGDLLGASGYDVIRSAGSKGAADLVAVGDGELLFLQVKGRTRTDRPGSPLSPAERVALLRIARRAGGRALQVHRLPQGSRVATVFSELTGPGPRDSRPWMPTPQGGAGE